MKTIVFGPVNLEMTPGFPYNTKSFNLAYRILSISDEHDRLWSADVWRKNYILLYMALRIGYRVSVNALCGASRARRRARKCASACIT